MSNKERETMFGKKKKEETMEAPKAPPKEEETETVVMSAPPIGSKQGAKPKAASALGKLILDEYIKDYDGLVTFNECSTMPTAEREAMKLSLLFAIYGELRLIRDTQAREEK